MYAWRWREEEHRHCGAVRVGFAIDEQGDVRHAYAIGGDRSSRLLHRGGIHPQQVLSRTWRACAEAARARSAKAAEKKRIVVAGCVRWCGGRWSAVAGSCRMQDAARPCPRAALYPTRGAGVVSRGSPTASAIWVMPAKPKKGGQLDHALPRGTDARHLISPAVGAGAQAHARHGVGAQIPDIARVPVWKCVGDTEDAGGMPVGAPHRLRIESEPRYRDGRPRWMLCVRHPFRCGKLAHCLWPVLGGLAQPSPVQACPGRSATLAEAPGA
jgi:hypothetical protein